MPGKEEKGYSGKKNFYAVYSYMFQDIRQYVIFLLRLFFLKSWLDIPATYLLFAFSKI